jgi:hypothetical protein
MQRELGNFNVEQLIGIIERNFESLEETCLS